MNISKMDYWFLVLAGFWIVIKNILSYFTPAFEPGGDALLGVVIVVLIRSVHFNMEN